MFQVVNLRTNLVWGTPDGESPKVYEKGEDAALAAKNLNSFVEKCCGWYTTNADGGSNYGGTEITGKWFKANDAGDGHVSEDDKWQVRKIEVVDDWRQREIDRMASGVYQPVPWANDPDWIEWVKNEPQCDHFLHTSQEKSESVAYTESDEKGKLDTQRRTTPTKYLTTFKVDYKLISRWTAIWAKVKSKVELKFATTREEIRHVYTNGPESCMKGVASRYYKDDKAPHPTEAYAAGDLAIAYLTNDVGKITARVLVWPEKKIYGRFYGDGSSMLMSLLEAEQFGRGSFVGSKMLSIPVDKWSKTVNSYAIPYLDGPGSYVEHDEENNVFVIKDNGYRQSDGGCWVVIPKPYVSQLSGKKFDPHKDAARTVYISQRKTQIWSTSEIKGNAYFCNHSSKWYSIKECPPETYWDGGIQNMSPFVGKKSKLKTCGYYGVKMPAENFSEVIVGYTKSGEPVTEEWSRGAIDMSLQDVVPGTGKRERYAYWLRSNISHISCAAHREHESMNVRDRNYAKTAKAVYSEPVTRENAHRLLRVGRIGPDGKMNAVYPSDLPKFESGVTPVTKIKKSLKRVIDVLNEELGA